jgi:opacity protein-like surface antigen
MNNMKIALLGTVVAAGIAISGGSAFAADLRMPMHSEPAPVMVAPASAGYYASVFGGFAFGSTVTGKYLATGTNASPTFPLQSGYVIGAALGTHLTPNLRGEVEVSYDAHSANGTSTAIRGGGGTFTDTDTGTFNTLNVFGNLWYDFNTGSSFTPYLGGGAGVAVLMPNFTSGSYTYTTNATEFAAQVGAGVKVQLADNIAVDVGYRLKGAFNGTLKGASSNQDVSNVRQIDQSVQVGLTFGF